MSGPVGSLAWPRAEGWSQVSLGKAGSSKGEERGVVASPRSSPGSL